MPHESASTVKGKRKVTDPNAPSTREELSAGILDEIHRNVESNPQFKRLGKLRPSRHLGFPVFFLFLLGSGLVVVGVNAYYQYSIPATMTVFQYVTPATPQFNLPDTAVGASGSQIFNAAFSMNTRGETVPFQFKVVGTVQFQNGTTGNLNRIFSSLRVTIQNSTTSNMTTIDALSPTPTYTTTLRVLDTTSYTVIFEWKIKSGIDLGALSAPVTIYLLIGEAS